MATLARRSAGLWAANLTAVAVGFVVPLALARLASQDDYGRFSFVTAVMALLSILTAPGLATAVTQGAAREQHGTLGVAIRGRVRASLAAIAATAVVGLWLMFFRDRTTGLVVMAAAPFMLPAYGLDLGVAFLNGLHRYRPMMVGLVAAAAVPAVAVLIALNAGASITTIVLAYFAALSAVNVVMLVSVLRSAVSNDAADAELIRYGKRLSWISSLGAVQFYFDRLIIGLALGFDEVAIYSVAKLFQHGLKSAWTAVNQQVFPRLAARGPAGAGELTRRTLVPLSAGFVALAVAGAVAAPVVVPLVFGSAYAASVTPAILLMAAFVLGVPGAQFEMMFRAVADERRLYVQRISFTVAEIVCTGAGAWIDGVTGACIGMLVAYSFNSVLGWMLDRRR